MYKFYLKDVVKAHQYEELIKIFLKPDQFIVVLDERDENCSNVLGKADPKLAEYDFSKEYEFSFDGDANVLKKEIYLYFRDMFLYKFTFVSIPIGIPKK